MLDEQSVEYWVKINVHFILNNSRYMYAIKTESHLKDVCSFFSGMNGQLYPDSLVAGALAMALCRILGIFSAKLQCCFEHNINYCKCNNTCTLYLLGHGDS